MIVKHSPCFGTQTAQDAIAEASGWVAQQVYDFHRNLLSTCGPLISLTESPIEAVFWCWWSALDGVFIYKVQGPPPFALTPQHWVSIDGANYRLDFAVVKHSIAIELDGHDFHERTKEQVIARNERDRRLQAAGWTVLHYSGTELLRTSYAVVVEVYRQCLQREGIEVDL